MHLMPPSELTLLRWNRIEFLWGTYFQASPVTRVSFIYYWLLLTFATPRNGKLLLLLLQKCGEGSGKVWHNRVLFVPKTRKKLYVVDAGERGKKKRFFSSLRRRHILIRHSPFFMHILCC
jgi:hypothetical protein